MIEVPVGAGRFALVDDEDAALVAGYTWRLGKQGSITYIYAITDVGDRVLAMHQVILDIHDPRVDFGHVDGNRLNNRRANLRHTRLPPRPQEPSRFQGVGRGKNKRQGSWVVWLYLPDDGHRTYLGAYTEEVEAAQAYDRAARERCRPGSVELNFPTEDEATERAAWLVRRRATRRAMRHA